MDDTIEAKATTSGEEGDLENRQNEKLSDGRSETEQPPEGEPANKKSPDENPPDKSSDEKLAADKFVEGKSIDDNNSGGDRIAVDKPVENKSGEEKTVDEKSASGSGDGKQTEEKLDYDKLDFRKLDNEQLMNDKIFEQLLRTEVKKVVKARAHLRSKIVRLESEISKIQIDAIKKFEPVPLNHGLDNLDRNSSPEVTEALKLRCNELAKDTELTISKARENILVLQKILKVQRNEELEKEVNEINDAINRLADLKPSMFKKSEPTAEKANGNVSKLDENNGNVVAEKKEVTPSQETCNVSEQNKETASGSEESKESSSKIEVNKGKSTVLEQGKETPSVSENSAESVSQSEPNILLEQCNKLDEEKEMFSKSEPVKETSTDLNE